MSLYRIAVFASGQGSNFQAIVDQIQKGTLQVSVELLVCDRPQAKVVQRAQQAGVPVLCIEPKSYANRETYEQVILHQLRANSIELIVLAGYMRLISSVLLEAYKDRIINVHPSLLPAFPGKDAIRQAHQYGVKVTGVTVHFVDQGIDSGPIIVQQCIDILPDESEESLTMRIHALEHRCLPQVIQWFQADQIKLDGRKVMITS
jgi:phosphoribosylglycinamide formyltransferase-1